VPEPFVHTLFIQARASYNRQPEPVKQPPAAARHGGFLEIRAV
jgi:hypothetical protein